MEFIQNADDCESEYLKIVINNKEVNTGFPAFFNIQTHTAKTMSPRLYGLQFTLVNKFR